MYTPTYQLSPALFTEIAQIERFYGQIEALKIPGSLEINLTRDNMIQSSYASNKIEGNPLTLPEVTNLLLDDRVPANRSEKEVVNYFGLLKKLPDFTTTPITTTLITDFHRQLLSGVDASAGSIRNVKVVVGRMQKDQGSQTLRVKHDPPFHTRSEIEKQLQVLCRWTHTPNTPHAVITSGIFHHEFVFLHPFEDGNGRVCRLLTALLFIKMGYSINKYFILDDYYDIDRHLYSDKLHAADTGDKTEWLLYFAEGVKYSLQSALARLENAMRTLPVRKRPTPKEQEVLAMFDTVKELTSKDIAKQMAVTRQQAHALLSGLVEKGILEKQGSTKSSFYRVK